VGCAKEAKRNSIRSIGLYSSEKTAEERTIAALVMNSWDIPTSFKELYTI